MNEDHQIQTETQKGEYFEDEIELIDILRVIWKWKYLIIAGTIFCGVIAAIISLNMAKIYSIDVVLRPGILDIGDSEENVYIDTPQNIKALIDSEMFNNDILNYLNEIKMENIPKKLEFKVRIPKDSDTIKVEHETDNIKRGMFIQDRLIKLMLDTYSSKVKYFENEFDMKIKEKNNDISKIINDISKTKSDIASIKTTTKNKLKQNDNKISVLMKKKEAQNNQINNLKKRIVDIEKEIGRISKNADSLIEERNKFLSSAKNENNILSTLIYSNTIQQNISYMNSLRSTINDSNHQIYQEEVGVESTENAIKDLKNEKESLVKQTQYSVEIIETGIKDLENNKKYGLAEIKNLQFKRDSIQNVQATHPPQNKPNPIKPKKMLIVLLSLVAGLFLMLFLSFLLEYLSKYKGRMHQ
jgi:capsular polysaccharide biosynthesis protein